MAENNEKAMDLRNAFGTTLLELGKSYPQMLFLDGDLHTSTRAVIFKEAYPARFYQLGVAEQNLFGVAAGLALEGFIPIPSTFASFVARRALDQIAISIAYPKLNVKIPGSYVGVTTSRAGASHNCIEDIAVMRSIPHFKVADPGSCRELASVMHAAMAVDGPVYYRVARFSLPEFLPEGYTFEWGKGLRLREGKDVTLFGTGIMTFFCLLAADILAGDRIEAEVVHLSSIKPLDIGLIEGSLARTGCGVTAENASVTGGFGSAVAEAVCRRRPVPLLRIGVQDMFVESGGIQELFAHHGMLPEDIARAAGEVMAARDSGHVSAGSEASGDSRRGSGPKGACE